MVALTQRRLIKAEFVALGVGQDEEAELADRLGVTSRTVRRDVERLRTLGYQVHVSQGAGGGYRLGPGQDLPPLLLDDEEAIATAVSLLAGAGAGAGGAGGAGSTGGGDTEAP